MVGREGGGVRGREDVRARGCEGRREDKARERVGGRDRRRERGGKEVEREGER